MKKMASITMIALLATASIGSAEVLFDVDFSEDTVGNTPSTASYTQGTTKPTGVNAGSDPESLTVVASAGTLTNAAQFVNDPLTNQVPTLTFDGGNGLVTSEIVRLEWDFYVSAATNDATHTIAAFAAYGDAGANILAVTLTRLSGSDGGQLSQAFGSGYDSGADLTWSIGELLQFEMEIDIDNDTYSIWKNGTQIATDLALSTATSSFRGIVFRDGWAMGGNAETATYSADNILIQTVPEPATMSLLALGAAALLRRKRSC